MTQDMGASLRDRATHEPSPTVSAVPVGIPSAQVILIDREEYARRRESEIPSALQSRKVFGSWAAYAQSLLHGIVTWERDPGHQWGSFHHQCAIAAAGLLEELDAQAMSAGTAETQSGSGRQPASAVPNWDAP